MLAFEIVLCYKELSMTEQHEYPKKPVVPLVQKPIVVDGKKYGPLSPPPNNG